MWEPVDRITARWKPTEGAGLEHLVLQAKAGGYLANSQVVGEDDGTRYAFTYEIQMIKVGGFYHSGLTPSTAKR